jgi:hypothetical protein
VDPVDYDENSITAKILSRMGGENKESNVLITPMKLTGNYSAVQIEYPQKVEGRVLTKRGWVNEVEEIPLVCTVSRSFVESFDSCKTTPPKPPSGSSAEGSSRKNDGGSTGSDAK